MIHVEPSETNRLAARAALQLGILRTYDSGLAYIAPGLCGLSDHDLKHGQKLARHTLDHWAAVATAARRFVQAGHFGRAA